MFHLQHQRCLKRRVLQIAGILMVGLQTSCASTMEFLGDLPFLPDLSSPAKIEQPPQASSATTSSVVRQASDEKQAAQAAQSPGPISNLDDAPLSKAPSRMPAASPTLPLPKSLPELPADAALEEQKRPLPINLPTALKLIQASPIDVQVAGQRIQAAQAQLDQANVLWLPTIYLGVDYFRQDGQLQDIVGNIFSTNKSALMVGAGPYAFFALSDAIYAPLSARQVARARQFDRQTALNDTMLSVAEAYFTVQQARGELAGSLDTQRRAKDLVEKTVKLATDLANPVEVLRAKTELARRDQAIESTLERWRTASSELTRLLRLDPSAVVVPLEPPHLRVELIDTATAVDELIPVALRHRPELSSQQALVEAALARLKQERMRPLIPSLALRGNSTNPTSTLAGGVFGGGINGSMSNFNLRNGIDAQVLWEFQNLGLGNRAIIRQRKVESEQAVLEQFRVQDRVAAEVAQAHEQALRAANRARIAQEGLKFAVESAQKNVEGLSQTRRVGELLVLVFRPQEVVASIQALEQAYRDYYGAVADSNRAQFRLYRALGQPAQCVSGAGMGDIPGKSAPAAEVQQQSPIRTSSLDAK